MSRLFGTDGVRGVVGTHIGEDVNGETAMLDADLACALGSAAVRKLGRRVLIGRDSRVSGPMLEDALVAGIRAEGGEPLLAGIIPTPAIAFLVRELGCDCGIVISASHNPPQHNGIKFFDDQGFKLTDAVEDQMEALVVMLMGRDVPAYEPGVVVEDAAERYVRHCVDIVREQGITLEGMTIALDCAYGASCATTPAALRELGATVHAINAEPCGEKINVGCGSTHLEQVTQLMREVGADIAIAHDGDADRMLAVAPNGEVIDGDFIIAICVNDMLQRGGLAGNMVVATVMANIGFMQAMERMGVQVDTTKVGDRYVLESMRAHGAKIGGEQSGHVIFLEHNTTGDGLLSALQLLADVKRGGGDVATCMQVMERFPQALVNVHVVDKALYAGNAAIAAAEDAARRGLAGEGRLLVRPSGTEPLIRVMVEARTQERADTVANEVAAVVREQIGA